MNERDKREQREAGEVVGTLADDEAERVGAGGWPFFEGDESDRYLGWLFAAGLVGLVLAMKKKP